MLNVTHAKLVIGNNQTELNVVCYLYTIIKIKTPHSRNNVFNTNCLTINKTKKT